MQSIDIQKCLHCPAVSFCDGEPLTHQNCVKADDKRKNGGKR